MNHSLNLINLVYDLLSYSTIIILLFYLFKKKKIFAVHFILLSFFCVTPFLLNNILFDYMEFPDQIKYARGANNFRTGAAFFQGIGGPTDLSVWTASLMFSLFPVISFHSINTIAFINKVIIVYLFLFFKDKNVSKFFIYSLILFPSIIIYSSLALRDIGIIFFMIMFAYYFFKGRVVIATIFFVILFLLKPQNALTIIIMLTAFKLLFELKNYTLNGIIILIGIVIVLGFNEQILQQLNNYRLGFFTEYNGYSEELNQYYEDDRTLSLDLKSFYLSFFQYLKTFMYPLSDELSLNKIIFFLDNILFSILFLINCLVLYKKNTKYVIFWFLLYIIMNVLLSIITMNEMTLLRYKMSWVIFFIFCLSYTCNNQKIKPKD